MLELNSQTHAAMNRKLITSLAHSATEVLEAQRLRYKVYTEEMAANIPGAGVEIDRDIFDKYCVHVLVRESDSAKVVGTYRILSPGQAQKIGGYYSQGEFDLTRLLHLSDRLVEVGRFCVHREYRDGATLSQLWGGLAQYIQQHGYEYLIGCATIGIADGGHVAASIYRKLSRLYAAPIEYSVFPRNPLPLQALNQFLDVPIPQQIKGYLRLGAYICGEPGWDPEFNTANLLMMLPVSRIGSRYAKHFLKHPSGKHPVNP